MSTATHHRPHSARHHATPTTRPGFYQRAIEEALAKMPLGCLEATLPDGSTRRFGNAPQPTARLRILRPGFFKRCVLFGDIGFGEAFVDGDWDTDDLPAVLAWFIENVEHAPGMSGSRRSPLALNLLRGANRVQHLLRPNSVKVSRRNIAEHYDLGNDFYRLWLDPSMTYSSGFFVSPELTLEQAQTAKYDALCRSLRLKPADHLLEIGSGWGGMACHAAKNYGCRVTTLTISEAQLAYCKERFIQEGIADRVEVRLQDYRHTTGQFDKIVSIEMLEAVGERYVDGYFAQCARLLKRDGLLALQYITSPDSRYEQFRKGVDWIQKHIFPGSLLMSVGRVTQALQRGTDLHLHNLHDMGHHYARTLREWRARFNAHHPELRKLRFDDHFIRKWNYYLSYCEAAFAQRNISVVQALYTRPNNRTLI
ncbi:cyclopropane-fatty-acyl-phospholipid synthase [Verrucomicrobiota bacterium]|nr:cyclopropane-fatty-acyl-phospholipid synthase [Verrucomicrobiota bacterium]